MSLNKVRERVRHGVRWYFRGELSCGQVILVVFAGIVLAFVLRVWLVLRIVLSRV